MSGSAGQKVRLSVTDCLTGNRLLSRHLLKVVQPNKPKGENMKPFKPKASDGTSANARKFAEVKRIISELTDIADGLILTMNVHNSGHHMIFNTADDREGLSVRLDTDFVDVEVFVRDPYKTVSAFSSSLTLRGYQEFTRKFVGRYVDAFRCADE